MTTALYAILFTYGYAYGFWCLYVLVMGLYRAHLTTKLTGFTLWMAYPVVILAYMVDLFANWTFASIWFWEGPRGPRELVTDRLTRYLSHSGGWRRNHAKWLCETLLDAFDPSGQHCKTNS